MSVAGAVSRALAVGIGISLGVFGGGGSILAVPVLVYVAGLPAKQAIATSLLVVGATSAVGAARHGLAGRVHWRTGLAFGAAGVAGAYAGGRLAVLVPDAVLLTGFAGMMLATAVAMIRGRRTTPGHPARDLPVPRVIAQGGAVGLVSGLVGAGGGFLVVPALTLLGGLTMPVAVGTSLLVIAMQSLAGLAGHLSTTTVHWGLASAVTAAAIGGGLVGARLAGRIRDDLLRRWFGWFVLAMGTLVLGRQLPAHPRADALLWTVLGVIAAAMVTAAVTSTRRRPAPRPVDPDPEPRVAPTGS